MANGHGGRRKNSGPKQDPQRKEFRAAIREKLTAPGIVERLWKKAWRAKTPTLLIELVRHGIGMPPQTVTGPEGGPIVHRHVIDWGDTDDGNGVNGAG